MVCRITTTLGFDVERGLRWRLVALMSEKGFVVAVGLFSSRLLALMSEIGFANGC
jgi:hypothetical protein